MRSDTSGSYREIGIDFVSSSRERLCLGITMKASKFNASGSPLLHVAFGTAGADQKELRFAKPSESAGERNLKSASRMTTSVATTAASTRR